MKKSALLLFLGSTMALVSCSSTGGPSGGLLGLVTGGVLGHLIDTNSGTNSSTATSVGSTGTTGSTGTGSSTGTSSSSNGVNALLLGTTTTTGTDPKTGVTTNSLKNQYAVINNGTGTDDFFGTHKGAITGALAGAAAGMITDQFRTNEIQKKYDEGYAKAKSDSIKEFYWLKRDAQKAKNGGDEPPVQYRYYEVEVPAHTTSDGVFIDKHKRVIEVVE